MIRLIDNSDSCPDFFSNSEGTEKVQYLRSLITEQARTPLGQWHRTIRQFQIGLQDCCDYFDAGKIIAGWHYLDLLIGNTCDTIELSVLTGELGDLSLPPKKQGKVALFTIQFLNKQKLIGLRVMAIRTSGQIDGIWDFGLLTDNESAQPITASMITKKFAEYANS